MLYNYTIQDTIYSLYPNRVISFIYVTNYAISTNIPQGQHCLVILKDMLFVLIYRFHQFLLGKIVVNSFIYFISV